VQEKLHFFRANNKWQGAQNLKGVCFPTKRANAMGKGG